METIRPRAWVVYAKAIAFLLPVFFFCAAANIFVLPKLETIWRDAGLADQPELWMVQTPKFLLRNGLLMCGCIALALISLEFVAKRWVVVRSTVVGSLVFVINGAGLFALTLMLMAAILAAPAFAKAQGTRQAGYMRGGAVVAVVAR